MKIIKLNFKTYKIIIRKQKANFFHNFYKKYIFEIDKEIQQLKDLINYMQNKMNDINRISTSDLEKSQSYSLINL